MGILALWLAKCVEIGALLAVQTNGLIRPTFSSSLARARLALGHMPMTQLSSNSSDCIQRTLYSASGHHLVTRSHKLYTNWGATAKAEQLVQAHPEFFS